MAGGGKVTEDDVVRLLGTPPDERTVAIARAIADGQAGDALGEMDGLLNSGVALSSVVTALGEIFRNMMLAATCGADSELIELPDTQRAAVAELAGRLSLPSLVHAVAVISRTASSVRGSSVARALVEAAVVRLAEADKFVDPDSLIERLESLAGGGATGRSGPAPETGGGATRPFAAGSAERPACLPAGQARAEATSPPPVAAPSPPAAPQDLSSDEKQEIRNDPAVRQVLDLFGGQVVDIRKDGSVFGDDPQTTQEE